MDDIRIPGIVWFAGAPPPDLSGISQPIRIPFKLRVPVNQPRQSGDPTEVAKRARVRFFRPAYRRLSVTIVR